MNTEQPKEVVMPVTKLSYSSLTQLLRNPIIFKMKEILRIYDTKKSVSSVIGSAIHETLKVYYGGSDIFVPHDIPEARGIAREQGLLYIEKQSDANIDYGKKGSREEILKGFAKALDFYFAEEPVYHKILFCETKFEAQMHSLNGDILPLPGVGKADLVVENRDGTVDIIDYKVVKSFTDYEDEDGVKIVQAMFMKRLLFAAEGIKARRVIFREIKRTENETDKVTGRRPSQLRDWVVPCDHEPYDIIFDNLYRDVVRYLSSNPIFLPNLSDMFDGDHAWMIYSQGLISSDMSDVEVMHKVRDVAFTSKKFLASRIDSELNKDLLPEEKIKLRLAEFGIPVEPVEKKVGSSITQYRFKVSAGIRMSTIEKHKADIALAIEAKGEIRILAPIPGTSLVGVEVANEKRTSVKMNKSELVPTTMSLPIGVDIHGEVIKTPLDQMPHLLIAGSTGSGKSILLHSLINALIKQMKPKDLQMILIDPKRVELSAFRNIRHLKGGKIIYEYDQSLFMLKGLSDEMEVRYRLLEKSHARDIGDYNKVEDKDREKIPYIVTVIDEFADLMLQAKNEEKKKKAKQSLKNVVTREYYMQMARDYAKRGITFNPEIEADDLMTAEEYIARIAAMGRAVGIHLIIATQRPSVDVITGLIKANFPTRIALTTASATDSKVILGEEGAEKLTGKGDMLYMHPGNKGRVRLQGFINE